MWAGIDTDHWSHEQVFRFLGDLNHSTAGYRVHKGTRQPRGESEFTHERLLRSALWRGLAYTSNLILIVKVLDFIESVDLGVAKR